ncbi:Uncharacterized N-acetyltransferase YjaB [Chlamydia abortus]|uniref:GNAT family N-acetyltransferase n=2 Tax=Paenibacillus TaxID=44249 RepID=A0ABW3DFR5_9BACL|nr:Uncharacterized N-acetyltransferase YjaB [Chlamydia abortus]
MHNRKATTNDYAAILNLWEQSVAATHHFVSFNDIQDMKIEIPSYFPHLDVRLWYAESSLIGFSATNGYHLEMLFLDPGQIGKGYGKQIIRSLIHDYGVTSVDVNKQNENAVMFYLKSGFSMVSEDATDSAGRPYPILHLQYSGKQK